MIFGAILSQATLKCTYTRVVISPLPKLSLIAYMYDSMPRRHRGLEDAIRRIIAIHRE